MPSWKQQEEGEGWGYKKGSVGCKERGLRGKVWSWFCPCPAGS